MREEHLQPPLNQEEFEKEKMIEEQIHIICKDSVRNKNATEHQDIYDALFEMVEGKIEIARFEIIEEEEVFHAEKL